MKTTRRKFLENAALAGISPSVAGVFGGCATGARRDKVRLACVGIASAQSALRTEQ